MNKKLTIDEFAEIVEAIFQVYDPDQDFVKKVLINDDWSSDDELIQYFTENRFEKQMILELLPYRNYFLDFRYSQHI